MITEIEKTETTSFTFNNGYVGKYGGAFVPPVLAGKLEKLTEVFEIAKKTESFQQELSSLLIDYVGRPSPLYFAKRLSEYIEAKIYLKREDLNHTGAHKINNTLGQALLAREMKATEIIAETGAGQHGVATATVAALFGIPCKIFMGAKDAHRQQMNVKRIELLGAEVVITKRGTATLRDAVDAALEYYIQNPDVFYLLGSQVGPHPYPDMVGYFQSIIGREARKQILEKENKLPDAVIACLGGGSNAIGIFSGFLNDKSVKLYGAEGGGIGNNAGETAATLNFGKPMILQGTYSYCLVDSNGEASKTQSIAAGLDYPGISPMHAYLKDCKRASYYPISDNQAIEAFKLTCRLEGIIPAIESSHAIALAIEVLKNSNKTAIVNLSGRGDKDSQRDDM
ncbi:MAG: tryptophan synthase subunit beta [Bacteroidetes bacterium RIFOXYA12_FULL_33_9]|nr:MAG: tryptophan synthase subunit beta [Bacteroidetes bacterium RIFOXYA12_FULL_33_9]